MNYSIRDLEILTGIKAHTIRIWEKRYGLLDPMRTDTNIRFYSDNEMRLLLNVALLNKSGYKISTIQEMSSSEITQKVITLEDGAFANDLHINNLILAMMSFDEQRFGDIIDSCSDKFGFDYIIESLMLGFFKRIGLMWQVGEITPAKEHFVSNIFKQKIISTINSMSIEKKSGKTFLMFLPEGEYHEIALLFIKYLLHKNGHNIIYLGQNVPILSIKEVLDQKTIESLIVSITAPIQEDSFTEFLEGATSLTNFSSVLIGGNLNEKQKHLLPASFKYFNSIEEIREHLKSI